MEDSLKDVKASIGLDNSSNEKGASEVAKGTAESKPKSAQKARAAAAKVAAAAKAKQAAVRRVERVATQNDATRRDNSSHAPQVIDLRDDGEGVPPRPLPPDVVSQVQSQTQYDPPVLAPAENVYHAGDSAGDGMPSKERLSELANVELKQILDS